jgi:hypothetical protein
MYDSKNQPNPISKPPPPPPPRTHDLLEVLLVKAARRERGCAHADARGDERRLVAGDGVLVHREARELADALDARAVEPGGTEVDEDEVVVRPARNERLARAEERSRERLRVRDDLRRLGLEFGRGGLLERDGERADRVVVRAALEAGEDGEVDLVLNVLEDRRVSRLLRRGADALALEDHRAARAAERLVRRRRHDVAVWEGRGNRARRDEAGDVRHVRDELRAVRVRDLAHACVVDRARVGGGARDDELRALELRVALDGILVDDARPLVDALGERLEENRNGRDLLLVRLLAVREVAAVREVERHDAVVRREERRLDGEIRGRARERLDIDAPIAVRDAEGLERAALAEALDGVDVFVAAVVARAGLAFGVLVREDGAERVKDGRGREVLRRDEDERAALARLLLLDEVKNLRVHRRERLVEALRPLCERGRGLGRRTQCEGYRTTIWHERKTTPPHHMQFILLEYQK